MTNIGPNQSNSNTLSILGISFGVISFIFFPILLRPAAIIISVIAKTKEERLANIAITVSILGTVIGFILGAISWSFI